jgi:hypothetical protein
MAKNKGGSRVRPNASGNELFNADQRDRWHSWAEGHNRSAEFDGDSTAIRRSWFGRLLSKLPTPKSR